MIICMLDPSDEYLVEPCLIEGSLTLISCMRLVKQPEQAALSVLLLYCVRPEVAFSWGREGRQLWAEI